MKSLKDVIAELEIVLTDLNAIVAAAPAPVSDEDVEIDVITASGVVKKFTAVVPVA